MCYCNCKCWITSPQEKVHKLNCTLGPRLTTFSIERDKKQRVVEIKGKTYNINANVKKGVSEDSGRHLDQAIEIYRSLRDPVENRA